MGGDIEKQNTVSISLLLSDNTNVYETFLMQFLSELLIKGPNAPFYKSMIEPNFSGGFTPSTGLDHQPRDCVLTIGLQGVKKEDFDKVAVLFDETINSVVENGFDPEHIESVLHSYELSIKHEEKNFGLNLLFGLTPIWNHTDKIMLALQLHHLIEKLKTELKNNSNYLQDMVKQYFSENNHRLILTMSPDKDFETKLEKAEKQLIKKKTKGLSDKDKKDIYDKCLRLQKQQQDPGNTDLLPTLTMNHISSSVECVDKVQVTLNNIPTQINKVQSNGIVYFKGVLHTNELSLEEQMLLPLFCYVIGKLGTNRLNYREFDSLINRKTAGLRFNNHIAESLYHLHTYEPGIVIATHCLEKNVESMWDIWSQLFNITELIDVERFQMLVQLYTANLTHGIADAGHIYAMQAAASLVSGTSYQVELISGLHHIAYMRRLLHTSNYKAMLDEILNIGRIVFDRKKIRVALNISSENQSDVLHTYENFILKLPEAKSNIPSDTDGSTYVTGKIFAPSDAVNCQHHIINIPVNYCSKAILTAPYTHTDYPKLSILARLLTSKYLHPELREKQGAYGGGARLTGDGVFSFYSYRDPRNVETLDIFDKSHKWLEEQFDKITDQDILEAKLGVFQTVDAPIPPSAKGCEEFHKKVDARY
ncbi:hypothetical protein NQ317_011402 [Molorchus minor]|uniref:Peptidase M16C associated domain-containing protein n=1 Tax=Molorchus minor TaxID=1323400 RepID=A0ABQ9IYU3_9CUCU|nr:hypothetical protein NQ317_011402 [Molorchus minor]